ncbi:hypothetical protein GGR53DRAFT_109267 [Hypoxylon sp. FL1150]|nr:hypothetical protein GGR53DRAFT_109267 [Hypoxylon sp. FL1150]
MLVFPRSKTILWLQPIHFTGRAVASPPWPLLCVTYNMDSSFLRLSRRVSISESSIVLIYVNSTRMAFDPTEVRTRLTRVTKYSSRCVSSVAVVSHTTEAGRQFDVRPTVLVETVIFAAIHISVVIRY